MLVLSRKTQEQILIAGLNIRLTVLSVGKNRVQIGIEPSKGIQITRPEAGHRTSGSCGQQTLDIPCAEFAGLSSV